MEIWCLSCFNFFVPVLLFSKCILTQRIIPNGQDVGSGVAERIKPRKLMIRDFPFGEVSEAGLVRPEGNGGKFAGDRGQIVSRKVRNDGRRGIGARGGYQRTGA